MKTVIINYGLSNLLSVSRAVEYCGGKPEVTDDPEQVKIADSLILPGVGAFADGMNGLHSRSLDEALKDSVLRGVPLLGICLGMQMLFDESDEFGLHKGLGLIHGRVERIPELDWAGARQKIPNIGWSPLIMENEHSVFSSFPKDAQAYFVHSYEAKPQSKRNELASYEYGGRRVCAAAFSDNGRVIGCQFHPEKSGEAGITIIDNFLRL